MKKRYIYLLDAILLAGALIAIAGTMLYVRPVLNSPVSGYVTSEERVLFSFEKAEVILIDDNSAFTSPERIYAEDSIVISLKPGVYYWKAEGALPSEIRELTIQSEIDLRLKDAGESYEIVNAGNTPLEVDVYSYGSLREKIKLEPDQSVNSTGESFTGRESNA